MLCTRGFEPHLLRHLKIIMTKKKLRGIVGSVSLGLRLGILILIPIVLLALHLWFWALGIIILYYISNIIALISILKNKKMQSKTNATWLIVLFIAPGFAAYILSFGIYITKKQKKEFELAKELEEKISPKDITNSEIEFLSDGQKMFTKLFEELKKAKKYINIQYFIMSDGIIFRYLLDILKEKAKEGVKIRIIFDHVGSTYIQNSDFKELAKEGVEFIEFKKINWLFPISSLNFRNHNKFVIIDGKEAFFGGMNLADEYAHIDGFYGDWYDTHYFVKGDAVKSFNAIFITSWYAETKNDISEEYKSYESTTEIMNSFNKVSLLEDSPAKDEYVFYNEFLKQINNSQKTIRLITPYVVLPRNIKNAMRDAIARGVKIELITTDKIDKWTAFYVGGFDVDILTEMGVKVYRSKGIFLHTKAYIFDEHIKIIGTTNLDYRAFFLHYETNLLIKSDSFNEIIDYFNFIKSFSQLNERKTSDWSLGRYLMFNFIKFVKGNF